MLYRSMLYIYYKKLFNKKLFSKKYLKKNVNIKKIVNKKLKIIKKYKRLYFKIKKNKKKHIYKIKKYKKKLNSKKYNNNKSNKKINNKKYDKKINNKKYDNKNNKKYNKKINKKQINKKYKRKPSIYNQYTKSIGINKPNKKKLNIAKIKKIYKLNNKSILLFNLGNHKTIPYRKKLMNMKYRFRKRRKSRKSNSKFSKFKRSHYYKMSKQTNTSIKKKQYNKKYKYISYYRFSKYLRSINKQFTLMNNEQTNTDRYNYYKIKQENIKKRINNIKDNIHIVKNIKKNINIIYNKNNNINFNNKILNTEYNFIRSNNILKYIYNNTYTDNKIYYLIEILRININKKLYTNAVDYIHNTLSIVMFNNKHIKHRNSNKENIKFEKLNNRIIYSVRNYLKKINSIIILNERKKYGKIFKMDKIKKKIFKIEKKLLNRYLKYLFSTTYTNTKFKFNKKLKKLTILIKRKYKKRKKLQLIVNSITDNVNNNKNKSNNTNKLIYEKFNSKWINKVKKNINTAIQNKKKIYIKYIKKFYFFKHHAYGNINRNFIFLKHIYNMLDNMQYNICNNIYSNNNSSNKLLNNILYTQWTNQINNIFSTANNNVTKNNKYITNNNTIQHTAFIINNIKKKKILYKIKSKIVNKYKIENRKYYDTLHRNNIKKSLKNIAKYYNDDIKNYNIVLAKNKIKYITKNNLNYIFNNNTNVYYTIFNKKIRKYITYFNIKKKKKIINFYNTFKGYKYNKIKSCNNYKKTNISKLKKITVYNINNKCINKYIINYLLCLYNILYIFYKHSNILSITLNESSSNIRYYIHNNDKILHSKSIGAINVEKVNRRQWRKKLGEFLVYWLIKIIRKKRTNLIILN